MVYTNIFLYIHSDSWRTNVLSSLLTRISAAILHHDGDIVSHAALCRHAGVCIVVELSALIGYIRSDKLQTSVVSYFHKSSCINSNFSEKILNESCGHERIKSLLSFFIYLLFLHFN